MNCFLITTYNRTESLNALITSIRAISYNMPVIIIDDGSDEVNIKHKFCPYTKYIYRPHMGKAGYYDTVNALFREAKLKKYVNYFMLPDDVIIKPDFINRCINKWDEINDPGMITLNLITDRTNAPCWTAFNPVDKGHSYHTQWVDMCMMFRKPFFKYIGEIPKITRAWDRIPSLGSGVGSYISRAIHAQKGRMYQVKESFVEFQQSHFESRMHTPVKQKSVDVKDNILSLFKVYLANGGDDIKSLISHMEESIGADISSILENELKTRIFI